MSVKYYNKVTKAWEIFPGTAGKSAYRYAQDAGYTGTEEEFASQLANMETVLRRESVITNESDNFHYPTSKAVKDYVDNNSVIIPWAVMELTSNPTDAEVTSAFGTKENFKLLFDQVLEGKTCKLQTIKEGGYSTRTLEFFDCLAVKDASDPDIVWNLQLSCLFPSTSGPWLIQTIVIYYHENTNVFSDCVIFKTNPINWA